MASRALLQVGLVIWAIFALPRHLLGLPQLYDMTRELYGNDPAIAILIDRQQLAAAIGAGALLAFLCAGRALARALLPPTPGRTLPWLEAGIAGAGTALLIEAGSWALEVLLYPAEDTWLANPPSGELYTSIALAFGLMMQPRLRGGIARLVARPGPSV